MSRLLDFPPNMYELAPDEVALFGHDPDIKRCVEHFKAALGHEEWIKRRDVTAKRFYQSLIGEKPDPTGVGKFYDGKDLFAWYLFLGEAFNDHPQNYEVVFGCRVMPVFSALGRNIENLLKVGGYEERLKRLIFKERGQPNGGLFEFLVAAAYVREGYQVAFHPEEPGRGRTHDLDVIRSGRRFAIECKRMETGQYHEIERKRMRGLWKPASDFLVRTGESFCFDLTFKVEIDKIQNSFLLDLASDFLTKKIDNQIIHGDLAYGTMRRLDLSPLKAALSGSSWMHPGPKYNNFLLGSYRRYESLLLAHKIRFAQNPHFIDEVDQAVALRWVSGSDVAIGKKARDVMGKLVEANKQLPEDTVGIVHIGLDALGGDVVEQRRFDKIRTSVANFDTDGKPLRYVFCHYFSPEASIEEAWAIDETTSYHKASADPLPLNNTFLITPAKEPMRSGVHWDGAT